jgi:hypothetical protein
VSIERKLLALRAMADQTQSPEEARIAREKLARYESFTTVLRTLEEWRAIEAAERAEAVRLRDEDERAAILRRFEAGGFRGVTIRAGAGALEARHTPKRPDHAA